MNHVISQCLLDKTSDMKQKEMNLSDIVANKTKPKKPEAVHLSEMVGKTNTPKAPIKKGLFGMLSKDKPTKTLSVKTGATKKGSKKTKTPLTQKQAMSVAIFVGLLIIGIPLGLIIGAFIKQPSASGAIVSVNTPYLESPVQIADLLRISTTLQNPIEPKTHESPINGIKLTKTEYDDLKKRLPVAVMVNNHVIARPQSNLQKADIVFETIAESGITRYMPIFWSNEVNKVGPIRSARQYYIEWLSPFDAIYLHDGYASSDDPRVDAGGNIYTYGIKSMSTFGAWREYDGVRFAPHNEYTSPVAAWTHAEDYEWTGFPSTFESWRFKRDALTSERGDVIGADIVFWERLRNGGAYDVHWAYDSTINSYLRTVGGRPDIDQEADTQIKAKVVIIQNVKMTPTYDDKAHLIFDLIGQGNATILQDGKALEVTWKKTSRTSRTKYFDKDNKEIEFNRGLIWVEGVPKDDGSFAIINK